MATCPNKNLEEWKSIVASRGEDIAYYLWDKYEGNIPELEQQPVYLQKDRKESLRTAGLSYLENTLETLSSKFGLPYEVIFDENNPNKGYVDVISYDKPTIVVNADKASHDTPLHEYGHIFINLIKSSNKNLYSNLVKEVLGTKEGREELNNVKQHYLDYTLEEQIEETIVELLGRYARNEFDSESGIHKTIKKIWDSILEFLSKAFNVDIKDISPNISIEQLSKLLSNPNINFNQKSFIEQNLETIKEDNIKNKERLEKEYTDFKKIEDPSLLKEDDYKLVINKEEFNTFKIELETTISSLKAYSKRQLLTDIDNIKSKIKTIDQRDNFDYSRYPLFTKILPFIHPNLNTALWVLNNEEEKGNLDNRIKDSLSFLDKSLNDITKDLLSGYSIVERLGINVPNFYRVSSYKSDNANSVEEIENNFTNKLSELDKIIKNPKESDSYYDRRFKFSTETDTYSVNGKFRNGNISISFSSDKYGMKDVNSSLFFKVLPKVIDSISYMFSDLEYNTISFTPVSGESKKGSDLRLKGYNIFAKRLFGQFSLVAQDENTTTIPIPEMFKNQIHITENMYQKERQEPTLKEAPVSSTASPKTLAMVNDFLTRIGVDTKALKNIVIDGIKQDSAGAALLTQKLIQVVEGKEAQSLPEEAMHFAVAIIKQTNPALYKKLMSEINKYAILNEVFATYGQNPMYQKDGKPDVIMLKEEAIAKVLAETIIKNNEGSLEKPENIAKIQNLWDKIVDWFKNLISTSGFDQLSMDIMTGKIIGTAEDINEEEGKAFLQLDPQQSIIDRIKEVSNSIQKPTEGGYMINGKVIPRVSALVDAWYERTFRNGEINKTEFKQAVNDLKAEKGTAGHADLEYIQTLFVDENGYLRETPLDDSGYVSRINPNNREMYDILKKNLEARLKSFPKDTRFMAEVTIYNPKANRAGTVDFLAVTKEGDVSILDWKFMDLDTDKYTDIPWYKNTAWNLQMEQYRAILQNAYGVKGEKFKQTRMIPIKALYSKADEKQNIKPVLLNIKIGDVNIKNIKDDYLLPVPIKNEKTGKRKIDELLGDLNKLYTKLSDKKVPDSEKLNKDELLNSLFHSIRQLQVKENIQPLLRQAQLLNKSIEKLIERYEEKFVDQDAKSFGEKEVNDFVKEISDAQYAISIYTDLYSELKGLLGDSKEDEDLKKELRRTSENAKDLEDDLERVLEEYTENIIAKREDIDNFLSPEKVIKGFTKMFASTATLQSKAIQFLYKKANRAFAYSGMDTLNESKRLDELKTKFESWAKGKGLSYKNYFDILKKKDSNELIDEYNPEFYTDLKAKTKKELESFSDDRDSSWIRANIDVSAYNEHLKEKLAEEIERIKNKPRLLTSQEAEDLANGKLPNEVMMEIYKAKNLYNTSTTTSSGWFIYNETRKFPNKEKWTSEEWKELNKPENDPAKKFYDYIIEKNNEYADLGYISKQFARTFLPFIRKNLVEKLVTGGQVKLGQQFFTDISVDEGDIGYGQIDPDTGKVVNKIPKYFTRPLEQETSTDLFRTMAFYNEAALRYKYLSEIEDQVIAIVAVEKNKKSIETSMFGKSKIEDGVVQYTETKGENAKLVEDMMKAIIYGQKFVQSETFDQLLFKMGNWGETLNKKLGVGIFPENLSDRQLSVNKFINQMNNTFQITTLGFNILSATSNFFGGNAQSLINSGKYFTKKDYLAAEMMIFSRKFLGVNKEKLIGALEYFLPLTENYNREIAKKLSLNTLSQESIQDFLMILMKNTDLNVQTSNFYAFLNNSIVQDGKVINAREYLRTLPEYQEKYKGSVADRKAYDQKFDDEVKRLIEEKGVLKLGEVIDGKFVIPGVDQKSDSVIELRRKVQQVSKDALGNLSEDDLRKINMSVYGKSFMVFKNWIPRLVDVRLGGLKFNSASDAYEWGRTRMVFKVLTDEFSLTNPVAPFSGLGKLYNSLTGNEKGVEYMRDMFEKKRNEYESETGKTLEMTEAEFIDLARQNIKSQLVDVVFLASVFMLIGLLKANQPDDDEDKAVINRYKFYMKAVDKFKGELMYFYDPTSGLDLISQGFFPSAALITNFAKLMINFRKEMWALGTGDDETAEKTYVIKYLMKSFPIANQAPGLLPMFYPELAKDLGIKVQSNYGIR